MGEPTIASFSLFHYSLSISIYKNKEMGIKKKTINMIFKSLSFHNESAFLLKLKKARKIN